MYAPKHESKNPLIKYKIFIFLMHYILLNIYFNFLIFFKLLFLFFYKFIKWFLVPKLCIYNIIVLFTAFLNHTLSFLLRAIIPFIIATATGVPPFGPVVVIEGIFVLHKSSLDSLALT